MAKSIRDKTWDDFSLMYRAEQADESGMVICYTCGSRGRWKGDRFQVGHVVDGRSNAVLFEEEAVRIQCYQCNCCYGGNKEEYIPKFIKECGEEKLNELKRLKRTAVKYSKSDYVDMRIEFKARSKKAIKEKGLIV